MKLFAAGISHKTAPVELRERLAVKQSEIADLAFVLKEQLIPLLDEWKERLREAIDNAPPAAGFSPPSGSWV